MAAALSLDDLDSIGQNAQPKKKKKSGTKVKAKSTAKVAKPAKTVSTGVKKKKKKTASLLSDEPSIERLFDAEPVDVKKPKKVKADKPKKAKSREVPTSKEVALMEAQVGELLSEIPDIIKQENDQINEYMIMFDKLRSMSRICESRYLEKKESKDIYALMKLYDQMREVIADLRALRDVSQLGDILNVEVLGPLVESSANSIVKIRQELLAWCNSHLSPNDLANFTEVMDKIVRRNVKDVQTAYQGSLDKTVQIFSSSV